MKDTKNVLRVTNVNFVRTDARNVRASRLSAPTCVRKDSAPKDSEADCRTVSKTDSRDIVHTTTSKAAISHAHIKATASATATNKVDTSHVSNKATVHAITTAKKKATSHVRDMSAKAISHARDTSPDSNKDTALDITTAAKKAISHVRDTDARTTSNGQDISHGSREDSASHGRTSHITRKPTSNAASTTAKTISILQCPSD